MSLISKSFSLTHKTALINRTLIRSLSSCMSKTQYLIKQEDKILNKRTNKPILNEILKLNLTNQPNDIQKQIAQLIKSKPVVVFMKGTKSQPMCGFSKAVVDILKIHGVDFDSYNVLADENLRSGIKEFSNWPTIPQVFFNGEFVGGCDILLDMHRSGDLVDELKKIGIESKADDEDHDQKK